MVIKKEVVDETMVAKIAVGKSLSCRACVKAALRKEFGALRKMSHPSDVRVYALVSVVLGLGIAMLLPHSAGDLWQWVLNRAVVADAPAVAGTTDLTIPVEEEPWTTSTTGVMGWVLAPLEKEDGRTDRVHRKTGTLGERWRQ